MKVQLTSDWNDNGMIFKCGSVVDVSDRDGAILIAAGHELKHPDTPAKINPEMYSLGCNPNPFPLESTSKTFKEAKAPK